MTTLRDRGRAMRNRMAPVAAGVTLAASRRDEGGSRRTATIEDAVPTLTRTLTQTTGGVLIQYAERTYRIPAANYVLGRNGAVCEPEERDRFVEWIDGRDVTYECRPVSGEPAWKYADAGRTLLHVNAKRVFDDQRERS